MNGMSHQASKQASEWSNRLCTHTIWTHRHNLNRCNLWVWRNKRATFVCVVEYESWAKSCQKRASRVSFLSLDHHTCRLDSAYTVSTLLTYMEVHALALASYRCQFHGFTPLDVCVYGEKLGRERERERVCCLEKCQQRGDVQHKKKKWIDCNDV